MVALEVLERTRDAYLEECRELAIACIASFTPGNGPDAALYQNVLRYPLRSAKGLRPALCIATCRALGGLCEDAIPTAAALELYHNAFLVHDDVEDASERRRGAPTLLSELGAAHAINVGDAMLALSLKPLLANTERLDLGRALRLLELVSEMALRTVEGQALELEWIRARTWRIDEADYVRMVGLKTACYSFVTPLAAGAIIAEADEALVADLRALGEALGVAFQIQDDLLDLTGSPDVIGKEACGDLWEGKRTLVTTHYVRTAAAADAAWAIEVLDRGRHAPFVPLVARLDADLAGLVAEGALSPEARRAVETVIHRACGRDARAREDIAALQRRLEEHGSLAAAGAVAQRHADAARTLWQRVAPAFRAGVHREFVSAMIDYVIERPW
jgi:geranylgeranyl diphosphate synthase, type II